MLVVSYVLSVDIKIGGQVKSISIIRDRVVWEYGEDIWTVDIDIAVRVIVGKTNLMITAYDSLGGFLELIYLKKHFTGVTHKTDELKKYWMMKTDRFESVNYSHFRSGSFLVNSTNVPSLSRL